jgi:hypothetical protein
MSKGLAIFLATFIATINACKGIAPSTSSTQSDEKRSEVVETTPDQELPGCISRNFEVIQEGEHDSFGCVGKVLREDGELIGSCVLISPNAALTAAHCIVDEVPYWFETNMCERVKIKKAIPCPAYNKTMASNDIGVLMLETDCTETPAIVGSYLDLTRLELLTTVGYSFCIKKKSNLGTFFYYGTIVEDPTHMKFLPLSGTVWFGDSGGAVFESGGKLCGIISSFGLYGTQPFENSATHIFLYQEWIDTIIGENR